MKKFKHNPFLSPNDIDQFNQYVTEPYLSATDDGISMKDIGFHHWLEQLDTDARSSIQEVMSDIGQVRVAYVQHRLEGIRTGIPTSDLVSVVTQRLKSPGAKMLPTYKERLAHVCGIKDSGYAPID
jgi:hypothetical protein